MQKPQVTSSVTRFITSPTRRSLKRHFYAARRKLTGAARELHYFHRVGDPYCHLMIQVLPEFATRFGVTLVPHVIGRLDPDMYPEPEMLDAYDIGDATALSELYELQFPTGGRRPGRDISDHFMAALAAASRSPDFFKRAIELGKAYWSGQTLADENHSGANEWLRRDEALLSRLGHYFTATLYHEGEWYWGLDRLGHLEERLLAQGLGDPGDRALRFDRTWRGIFDPKAAPLPDPQPLELFFSARSPYSYIAYFRAKTFASALGVPVVLKPVLPMMMRGMKVPLAKRLYILTDAKREAERAGLPFGNIADPLGSGIERAYAVAYWAQGEGRLEPFFDSLLRGVAVEAIDAATDRGLKILVERAGLDWSGAQQALNQSEWRDWVQQHRDEMTSDGLWGVPSLRYGDLATWGQDRFWLIRRKALGATPGA